MTTTQRVSLETESEKTSELPAIALEDDVRPFRPSVAGWVARTFAWVLVAWLVLAVPGNYLSPFHVELATIGMFVTMAYYAIIGLSLNVLIGYTGTISLGHQAFVGVGSFVSAYIATDLGLSFWLAVPIAAVVGGLQAAVLGAVSLRVSGLYFALVTLAYGTFAENSLFGIESFTGGGAGKEALRPPGFDTDYAYYYVCLGFLAVVLWLDWRLTRTKGGRALHAIRENPRVASSYGINVKVYTLFAFVVSGVFAGIGGALMAHHQQVVQPGIFNFQLALIFVLMTVIGGLRNRLGVVMGSAFFAALEGGELVELLGIGGFLDSTIGLPVEFVAVVIGPFLLLLTLTQFPGGIGQQVAPLREWMLGRRFDLHAGKLREVEVSDVRA